MRLPLLLLISATTLAAACPAQRDTVDEVPVDARRAVVTLGETVELHDGRIRVTFLEMERGGSFADVTLEMVAGGASVTDEITAVRQREHSDPVRVGGWIVRIEGFPGVDSVRLVAWSE